MERQAALAIAPKLTAPFSVVGSVLMARSILAKAKRKSCHELLLFLACSDVLSSFAWFLSTWPIPKGTEGVAYASGTTATCTAHGFFLQLSLATPCLNASLAAYYLAASRYQVSEERLKKLLPYVLASCLVIPLGTAIAGLIMKSFNNAIFWCWINNFPLGCESGGLVACERGANADILRWAFYFGPLWFSFFFQIICFVLIYLYVLGIEEKNDRWRIVPNMRRGTTAEHRKYSRWVAKQAMCYMGAFFSTWFFKTILIGFETSKNNDPPYWLMFITALTVPAQGIMNYVAYRVKTQFHSCSVKVGTRIKSKLTSWSKTKKASSSEDAEQANQVANNSPHDQQQEQKCPTNMDPESAAQ